MQKQCAVLGAGPMGLAVAYQLIKEGYQPVVFEADDRVGGMTASFDFQGMTIERYYHFHCISDSGFLQVLQELGLQDKMHWVETKMGYFYQQRIMPWGNPLALLKFSGLSLVAKFRYGLHAFLSTKRKDWQPLDKLEASAWIHGWIGAEAYDVLWRKLFEYKFYHYAGNLSAAWIWSRIRRIGRSRYSLMREKLGYLDGGSDTLLHGMRAEIEKHGGIFQLSSPVSRVVIADGKVLGVEVGGKLLPFDKVISTIPLPYVPDIMPDLPPAILQQFRAINNIAVVCVIVKLRRALTDYFWLNVNDPDMDIPGLVEYTNLRPLSEHVVYVPFYLPFEHPTYQESNAAFQDKVQRYLLRIHPDLRPEDFLSIHVSRYRYAQPICQPGYLDNLPPVALPVEGLWVADTSYYYPEDRGISESIDFGRAMARQAVAA